MFSLLLVLSLLFYFDYVEPLIFGVLIFSTENLKFVALHELPGLKLGPGVFFNLMDLLLIFLFLFSVHKLKGRSYSGLFKGPMLAIFAIALINLGISILTNITTLSGRTGGLNLLRNIFGYSFYFSLIAHMDSTTKLKRVVFFVILICVVAFGIQLYEGLSGERTAIYSSGLAEDQYYGIGATISIGGENVMYNWNRSIPLTFLLMFIFYGASIYSNNLGFLVMLLLMFIGIAWGFVRVWYIMTVVGLCTLIILNVTSANLKRILVNTALIVTMILVFSNISVPTGKSSGGLLSDLVWNRFATLFQFNEDDNFIGRRVLTEQIWDRFKENPLVGLGFDPQNVNIDLGAINTLSCMGAPGLLAILWLIARMMKSAWRLQLIAKAPVIKGCSQGIMAAICGVVVGYSFSWDFFSRKEGIILITLMCYLIDRGMETVRGNGAKKEYSTKRKNY